MKSYALLSCLLLVSFSACAMEQSEDQAPSLEGQVPPLIDSIARLQGTYDCLKSAVKALTQLHGTSSRTPTQVETGLYLNLLRLQKQTLDHLLPMMNERNAALEAQVKKEELTDPFTARYATSSDDPTRMFVRRRELLNNQYYVSCRTKSLENITASIDGISSVTEPTVSQQVIEAASSSVNPFITLQ